MAIRPRQQAAQQLPTKKLAKQLHFSPFSLVHTNPKRYNFRY